MKKSRWKLYLFIAVLACISLGSTQSSITVFTIGDSTMCIFSLPDLRVGWGQVLQQFFTSDVKVTDAAKSGRSSKSFITEGYWNGVINQVKTGDYVVIQFGHNDEKTDSALHTDPYTSYKANLKKFVDETRAKGGYPILCTPIVRRYFNADGSVKLSHGDYPDAVRKLAVEMNVPIIDMELNTKALVESFGPDSSKKLFNYVSAGVSSYYPSGNSDDTHLNAFGASKVAPLFINGINDLKLGLTSYLKTTSVGEEIIRSSLPDKFSLSQNYPNPFNPSTVISWQIKIGSNVSLKVYDMLGREVATLVDEFKPAGNYNSTFSTLNSALSSGVYLYRLQAGNYSDTKKFILMK